jgi:hypothetical protein
VGKEDARFIHERVHPTVVRKENNRNPHEIDGDRNRLVQKLYKPPSVYNFFRTGPNSAVQRGERGSCPKARPCR